MNTPSNRPARIIPSYAGIVLQLQKPMQHGDARRWLTNPAVYGLRIPAELFGQILCFGGSYYVAGPACQFREHELRTATISGSVERINREAGTPAARLFKCASQAEAVAQLWHLVVEHYQIPADEAAAQVAQQQQRDQADDWIPDYPESAHEAQPE